MYLLLDSIETFEFYLYFCLNFSTASLTLCNDDKSNSNVSQIAFSDSFCIFCAAACAFFISLQASITLHPCKAKDRAVSKPLEEFYSIFIQSVLFLILAEKYEKCQRY